MRIKEIISQVERKHNKGESLYDGGYFRVEDVMKGNGFIVYKVIYKNCNKGGVYNSGITIREGIFASDYIAEIEIKAFSLVRDGENVNNDCPEKSFSIIEIEGQRIFLRNSYDGRVEVYKLDFVKSRAALLVKEFSAYEWLSENSKQDSKKDLYKLLLQSVYDVLRRSNPQGANSIEVFLICNGEKMGIGDQSFEKKRVTVEEIDENETIVLVGTEALYGTSMLYRVFKGSLKEKKASQIMPSCDARIGRVTGIRILPKERKAKFQIYEYFDKEKRESVYSTIKEAGF